MRDEIAAFIVEKLGEVAGGSIIDAAPQDRFQHDLRLDEVDSLASTELLVEVEEKYGISITDAEAAATNTLDDLVELILTKMKEH